MRNKWGGVCGLLIAIVVMCFVAVAPAFANGAGYTKEPGTTYHEELVAEGDIYIFQCYSGEGANGAEECLKIDGDSSIVALTTVVEMGAVVDDSGDKVGGWIEVNENIILQADMAPVEMVKRVNVCLPPKVVGVTDQVSAFRLRANTSQGASLYYHMEAMGLGEPPVMEGTFAESYHMVNAGGLTQRYLSVSGVNSNSLVIVSQNVAGVYEGIGSFTEIDTAATLPDWWDISP